MWYCSFQESCFCVCLAHDFRVPQFWWPPLYDLYNFHQDGGALKWWQFVTQKCSTCRFNMIFAVLHIGKNAQAIFGQVLAWLCHLVGWRYTHLSAGISASLRDTGVITFWWSRFTYQAILRYYKLPPLRIPTSPIQKILQQNHPTLAQTPTNALQGTSRFNLCAKSTSLQEAHTCGFPVLLGLADLPYRLVVVVEKPSWNIFVQMDPNENLTQIGQIENEAMIPTNPAACFKYAIILILICCGTKTCKTNQTKSYE